MRCIRCGNGVNETRSGLSVCRKKSCRLIQWYTTDKNAVAYRSAPNKISLICGALIPWNEVRA